jgi:hypothetical protein
VGDERLHPDLFLDPQRNGFEERTQPGRRVGQIAVKDAVELDERLLVERNVVEILQTDSAFAETVFDGEFGEVCVVLLPGEAFLLCGGDDLAVLNQTRRAVVIES